MDRNLIAKTLSAIFLMSGAVVLIGLQYKLPGYGLLFLSLVSAAAFRLSFTRDLILIMIGLVIISLVPITTDISFSHMTIMGLAMAAAVAAPYLISRYVYKEHSIKFPFRFGEKWTRNEWLYLLIVLAVGYFLLPFYMISTGVYQNWPAAPDASSITRLFLGTNGLGIWDELFFICTVFTLLRKHFTVWQANTIQAVLFTSFLYELGFEAWGPVIIYLFALIQGYIFKTTKSLSYVITVHLLFDFILFLVLLHAHQRQWFDIFLY